MYPKRKRQNNFICDPEGPFGPVLDSFNDSEVFIPRYKFVDYKMDLATIDEASFQIIKRLRANFTKFNDKVN